MPDLMDRLLRIGPLVMALAGCVLLIVAEFMPLLEIRVITVVKETRTAGAHHGYALLVIALAAAFMAWGANVGGSRPAAFALLGLAIAALVVVLAVDLPKVDDAGLTRELYEQAQASPREGFYLESLGAVLLLLGAAATLVLGRPAPPAARPAARAE